MMLPPLHSVRSSQICIGHAPTVVLAQQTDCGEKCEPERLPVRHEPLPKHPTALKFAPQLPTYALRAIARSAEAPAKRDLSRLCDGFNLSRAPQGSRLRECAVLAQIAGSMLLQDRARNREQDASRSPAMKESLEPRGSGSPRRPFGLLAMTGGICHARDFALQKSKSCVTVFPLADPGAGARLRR